MKKMELIKTLIWRSFHFIKFYFRAKNRYSIHNSTIYDFCLQVLDDRRRFYLFGDVQAWREELKQSRELIEIKDFGAGSQSISSTRKKDAIRDVYQKCSSPEFKGKWLSRMVWWWQSENILELGTCLGVGSAYLAGALKQSKYTGVEGSAVLSQWTKNGLQKIDAQHQRVINGRFEVVLPDLLEKENFDLIFVDGNHTKKATLGYDALIREKNQGRCLIIYDDINWNPEMQSAWQEIQAHPNNDFVIDLFFVGIVAINSSLKMIPRHFALIPFHWKPLPF